MPNRPDRETQDSLRLLQAFRLVMDAAARERIIALTEELSRSESREERNISARLIN